MNALHTLGLIEIRDMLAKGELAPTQVLEAALARIAATEPTIRACLTVCENEARAEAARLEAAGADSSKALWGVPVTVKDMLCTHGVRTTAASRMLENFIPPYDAFVVRRLKEAGAIIVAKSNMDEFAMGSGTEFSAFAATANPWDTSCVPGGSSGGAAASVAAQQVYGALGSDSGGSIRQPAALCGCVGLKPTYGRVSRYGAIAYGSSFEQVGPLARSIADAAQLLSVIAGHDPQDATSADYPVDDYVAAAQRRSLNGVTLGLPKEYWAEGLSSEVASACRAAALQARDLGATILEVSLPHLPYSIAAYCILSAAEGSANLARFDGMRYGLRVDGPDLAATYTASRSRGFGEEVKRRILLGAYVLSAGNYEAYYVKAAQARRLIRQDFQTALEQCDALLAPTSPVTAWKLGSLFDDLRASAPLAGYEKDIFTSSLNLAGLPGLSIPVGLGADAKLPVGIQILGRAFDEAGIIGIGAALEAALPPIGVPVV